MKYDIITIFPEFFDSVFSFGVIKKARDKKLIDITVHDLREYTEDKHNSVDDTPYGGGGGMLMMTGPLSKAIEDIKLKRKKSIVVLTSPQGEILNDKVVNELKEYDQVLILCGRYEGIDERIRELYVDREISIGDYVISGGEYAAGIIVDSVSRNIQGVLGNENSAVNDSFKNGLLEHPQYTKPEEFKNIKVPSVLLSGNHKEIEKWRRTESIKKTFIKRPELLDQSKLDLDETEYLKKIQNELKPNFKVYIALIHYPVYNKDLKKITTAFTNLDAHDIARAGKTYGVKKFFLVNPNNDQRALVKRVIDHWTTGPGVEFNTTRKEALEIVGINESIKEVLDEIEKIEKVKPKVVVTDARIKNNMLGYNELRDKIFNEDQPFLILFGTGWGLTEDVIDSADYILKPLKGFDDFNHLSVRSAAAVILDRLLCCKI
ncbi:MAG: tRNA (guanosine(37)-N1)-methyltransferase TrmD [Thermodesulfobacteriota bacterium]